LLLVIFFVTFSVWFYEENKVGYQSPFQRKLKALHHTASYHMTQNAPNKFSTENPSGLLMLDIHRVKYPSIATIVEEDQ